MDQSKLNTAFGRRVFHGCLAAIYDTGFHCWTQEYRGEMLVLSTQISFVLLDHVADGCERQRSDLRPTCRILRNCLKPRTAKVPILHNKFIPFQTDAIKAETFGKSWRLTQGAETSPSQQQNGRWQLQSQICNPDQKTLAWVTNDPSLSSADLE